MRWLALLAALALLRPASADVFTQRRLDTYWNNSTTESIAPGSLAEHFQALVGKSGLFTWQLEPGSYDMPPAAAKVLLQVELRLLGAGANLSLIHI